MVTILLVTGMMVVLLVFSYLFGYWAMGPMLAGFRPFVSPKKAARHPEKYRMTWRTGRFQCSWVPLYFYGLPTAEWANISHVISLRQTKRFAAFTMESGIIVHLFRVTPHRGILWGWLRRG